MSGYQTSLSATKRTLSKQFLGRVGIHAFSTDPSRGMIRVFAEMPVDIEHLSEEFHEIAALAQPFGTEFIWSDASLAPPKVAAVTGDGR